MPNNTLPSLSVRQEQTRDVIAVTRAAIGKWREIEEASLRETEVRLSEIEAWTNGQPLPEWAVAYIEDCDSANYAAPRSPDIGGCTPVERGLGDAVMATKYGDDNPTGSIELALCEAGLAKGVVEEIAAAAHAALEARHA